MPNISTCKYIFCPITTCGTWEVQEPSESEIIFTRYPSRKTIYKICVPFPLYAFCAPFIHSVDEYKVTSKGSVEITRKYVCQSDTTTLDDIYKLECTEVRTEDLGELKKNYCLRFRSNDEEACEDIFESLQANAHYRLEMSIHRENLSQRKYIANRVNEFLASKDIEIEGIPLSSANATDSNVNEERHGSEGVKVTSNPLLRSADSKAAEDTGNQSSEATQQGGEISKPRRKTMKEIMNERLAS